MSAASQHPQFNFTIRLTNAVSTSAAQMQNSVLSTIVVLQRLEVTANFTFNSINNRANQAANSFGLLLPKAQAVLAVITAIGAAAGYAFHKLDQFAEKSLTFYSSRESQVKKYEQLFQDRDVARFEYGRGLAIGQQTPLTSAQVLRAQGSLTTGGLKGQIAHDLLAGGTDLSTAASDEDREMVMKRYAYAIREISTMGKLRSRQLNMQLGTAGLNVGLVHQVIAEGRGFHGNPNSKLSLADQQSDYVEKLLRKGDVRSDEGLKAIAIALSRQFNDGGKLGGFARSQSGSIATLRSNREEALENLQKSFDADILPAVRRYKSALKESADAMGLNTKSGQDLRVVLADISNAGIGLKAIWEEFSTGFVKSFSASYIEQLKEMGITTTSMENSLGAAADVARDFGTALGKVGAAAAWVVHQLDKLAKVGDAVTHMFKADDAFVHGNFRQYAHEVGESINALRRPLAYDAKTAKQERDQLQKEIDEFNTQLNAPRGTSKGGGGIGTQVGFVRRDAPRALKPPKVGGNQGETGEGGEAAQSGGTGGQSSGGSGGGGGGIQVVGRGLTVNTMNIELHLGHDFDQAAQSYILQVAPGMLKEMIEKLAREMGT